jgi:hypothetical protein
MPTEILEISNNLCRKHGIEFVPLFLDCSKKEQLDVFDDIYSYSEEFLCMPWVLNDEWFFERYFSKIHKICFPIVPWDNVNINHDRDSTLSFILFGALYDDIRNPTMLFDALLKCNKSFKIITYCSEDTLHKEILRANIIVIIGNTNANQTPSKVFEIMGSGKPFIYLYQNENDFVIPAIYKYKLSYVLKYSDVVDNNKFEELFKWCNINKDKRMSYNDYIVGFPEYSIDNYIGKICGNYEKSQK